MKKKDWEANKDSNYERLNIEIDSLEINNPFVKK